MPDLVETIAYTRSGGVPWHEKGFPVGDNLTPDEMRIAAGVDWGVDKVPNYRVLDLPAGRVYLPIEGGFHLERNTDHRVLCPHVGSRYKVVQPAEAFKLFHDYVAAGEMTMETAGSLKDGEIIWGLAKFSDGFTLPGGDEVKGYLMLSKSYMYGNTLKSMLTSIRTVCNNTYMAGVKEASQKGALFQMSHSQTFNDEVINRIKQALGLANGMMRELRDAAKFLAKVEFSEEQGIRFLAHVYDQDLVTKIANRAVKDYRLPKKLSTLANDRGVSRTTKEVANLVYSQPGSDLPTRNTAWAWFNAVTYAHDHVLGRHQDTRLEASWFGAGSRTKRRAFDLAIEMAEKAA